MIKRTITDFTEKEYRQQAQNKNFQSIASYISGLKPTANKAVYTVYNNNVTKWSKVEDISSTTSLQTKYLGGSGNINGVIVNIARDYTGSNNIPLLAKKGDYGARLDNTAGAARYIFTKKTDYFDKLFNKEDLNVLPQYSFEGHLIEYRFFTYHLPMLLVNGSEGMGSGHAQKVLPRNPLEIIKALKNKLSGKKYSVPDVWYKGFKGKFTKLEDGQWKIEGTFERKNLTTTYVTEIPITTSLKSYKTQLDKLVEKKIIQNYEDLCDPMNDLILFEIKHSRDFGAKSDEEFMTIFKLISSEKENYTSIDENNRVVTFKSAEEIFDSFCRVKLEYTEKRKLFQIQKMRDDLKQQISRARFITAVINEEVIVNNKKKDDIIKQIEVIDKIIKIEDSYDYLLRMPLYSLTKEKVDEIKVKIKETKESILLLEGTDSKDIWIKEIEELEVVLKKGI